MDKLFIVPFALIWMTVAFFAILFLSSITNGYVLSVLWGWFMVPVFGLPHLSIVPAIGISLVVSYLTHQEKTGTSKKEDKEEHQWVLDLIWIVLLRPALALLMGWLVHLFM